VLSPQFSYSLENKLPGLTGGGIIGYFMPLNKDFHDFYGWGGLVSGLEASLRVLKFADNVGLYAVGHYSFFNKSGRNNFGDDLEWKQSFLSFGGRSCVQINFIHIGLGLGLTQMRITERFADYADYPEFNKSGLGVYMESVQRFRIYKFLQIGLNEKWDFKYMETDYKQLHVGGIAMFLGIYISAF
jgi:hypothetical protein